MKGKGYEHAAAYGMARLSFMNIDNIHVMRASLKSFLTLLQVRNGCNGQAIPHPAAGATG